jgi:hypothetical protein
MAKRKDVIKVNVSHKTWKLLDLAIKYSYMIYLLVKQLDANIPEEQKEAIARRIRIEDNEAEKREQGESIDENAVDLSRMFWKDLNNLIFKTPLALEIKKRLEGNKEYRDAGVSMKNAMLVAEVNKCLETEPEYLKVKVYYDFMDFPKMNTLIKDNVGPFIERFVYIAQNYHQKDGKKEIVKMLRECKNCIKESGDKDIVKMYKRWGRWGDYWTYSKRKVAKEKKEFAMMLYNKSQMFLSPDTNGYTEFQKMAAKIISYYEIISAFKEIVEVFSNETTEMQREERMSIINQFQLNANYGKIFTFFLLMRFPNKPLLLR